jgi:hypothetical protein
MPLAYMPAHLNASRTRNPRQSKLNAAQSNRRIPPRLRIPHVSSQFGKPIPRKQNNKSPVAKDNPKSKLVKKADGKKNKEEMDIGFLSAVKKMQLDDNYDMLDSDNDVLSLEGDEEISITSADV